MLVTPLCLYLLSISMWSRSGWGVGSGVACGAGVAGEDDSLRGESVWSRVAGGWGEDVWGELVTRSRCVLSWSCAASDPIRCSWHVWGEIQRLMTSLLWSGVVNQLIKVDGNMTRQDLVVVSSCDQFINLKENWEKYWSILMLSCATLQRTDEEKSVCDTKVITQSGTQSGNQFISLEGN